MSSPLRLLRKKQSVPLPSQYVTPPRNESSSEFIKRKQQSSNTYTSLNARPIVVRPAANSNSGMFTDSLFLTNFIASNL